MKDLTIIIPNYNTAQLVKNAIDSFKHSLFDVAYEIIVVDNGSEKGDIRTLRTLNVNVKNTKIIESLVNLGYGRANNLGLEIAKGKYILFLNSDTLADDINFVDIIQWMDNNPKVGAMSCKLKNRDGSIQGTGGYFPNLLRTFMWMFFLDDIPFMDLVIKPFHPQKAKSFIKNDSFFRKYREIDWITGAFFLARRNVLGDGFDKEIFMYGEDIELSKRIKDKGYSVVYNPSWSIIHLGGKSSDSSFPIISEFEGIKHYYKKHMHPYQLPILRLLLITGIAFRIGVFYLLGKRNLSKTYAEAIATI